MGALQFFRDHGFFRRTRDRSAGASARLHEHEELRKLLERTRRSVADCSASLTRGRRAGSGRHACLRDLADLEAAVLRHFALEDAGDSLSDLLRVAPRYAARAEELQAEHASLARELRSVCELGEICGRSQERWSELEWRLEAFARNLQAHESAENEIASRAFLEDVGSAD
jgi:hypothetical protein